MSLFTTGTELGRFRKGTLPKIAIAVLLFIPLIYGALYLWAFWAPTDNMDRLPVAIVNLDKPAEKPDGGELSAGADVVHELLDGGDLDWQTTNAKEAAERVSDGDVYFSVTIPADFSATLAGLQDDPKAGQIDVVYNDNNSFLASTLGKQAMVQLRDAVAETTTRTAAEQVLVGVEKLSDGTRDAAKAADKLNDGSAALEQASGKLSAGLGDFSEGTSQLADSAPQLAAGVNTLANGLGEATTGSATLASGSAELASKTSEASTGATALSEGMTALSEGVSTLNTKTGEAAAGGAQLSTGIGNLAAGAESVAQGTGLIAQLAAANPDMTLAQLDAAFAGKGSSLGALAQGASALQTGAGTAATSASTLSEGLSGLSQATTTLNSKTAEASTGAANLSGGLAQLATGAQTVSDGNATLSSKLGTAATGANTLASKSSELVPGTAKLSEGAKKADAGSTQLAEGATKLHEGSDTFATKLSDGAKEAPSFASGQTDRIATTMAAPVELHETTENPVQGFGEGFAPFFIALATFVGALITWLILHAMPRRPLATNTSGLRTVLAGFWPAAIIGVGQVAIMMAVLVFGIGIRPAHWLGMSLFMLLVTFAFLALQQMFIVLLGTATGRVVSLVLLMLQLSSSGGTYPVETTPGFFQALHPFMPASYVVDGLRQMIGGGVDYRFWVALAVMFAVLLGSLALSAASARSQKVWTMKRLHPELAI
ncbi:YhgE/Pip domain-containing protein [Leucobacter viscericola]|uniref:YhgE/Pip domain-containing protein n=1 Tax=Leucobacter viscericola TaxID=2714935 RepID=A0A6G7XER5_9MICO|nr:YhgE/Pip domain-containing protein [Leucobacter viscericola]QIK63055.1 YhgE/Pip domain-containing protein [Leucobacter viscericola]